MSRPDLNPNRQFAVATDEKLDRIVEAGRRPVERDSLYRSVREEFTDLPPEWTPGASSTSAVA